MNEQNRDLLSNNQLYRQPLPNATATLVLGILSIVVCMVCGIIALLISNKEVDMYKANPDFYDAASYNNLKAGRICAIIGIIIQSLFFLLYIAIIAFAIYGSKGFN